MRIHENKDKQVHSKPTCGYCRKEGHNQYQCPHVAEDWKSLSKYRIPLDENGNIIRRGWHGQSNTGKDPLQMTIYNNLFSSWFTACQKAMNGQIARKAKGNKRKKSTTRICGYCGSADHTRRNCDDMKQFLKDCYKANENWRRKAYDELVNQYGISVGACVKVKYSDSYWSNRDQKEGMGIITDINWGSLNLFSSCNSISEFANSPLSIKVLINGDHKTISNVNTFFEIIGKNGRPRGWYNNCELISIITPAKEKLAPSWITDYKESFETLVKKKSEQILKTGMKSEYSAPNLWAHVQRWKSNV